MSNNQTIRFLFLILALITLPAAKVAARDCSSLFVSTGYLNNQNALQLVSERLIAPAIDRYVQLQKTAPEVPEATASGRTSDAFEAMMERITSQVPRPPLANGDYVNRPLSRQARFDEMLARAKAASEHRRAIANPVDPVVAVFNRIQQDAKRTGVITQTDFDLVRGRPIEFAIVYAQIFGLVAYAGEPGMVLTRYVPWTGYVSPKNFAAFSGVASMSRAMNSNPQQQRAIDNLVLEVLRSEFAPLGLELELDVAKGY